MAGTAHTGTDHGHSHRAVAAHAGDPSPESPVNVIHLDFTNKGFSELEVFRVVSTDKRSGRRVVDAKNTMVESADQIAGRIKLALEVVPADRAAGVPDCGLSYISRTAFAKLRNMGEAADTIRKGFVAAARETSRRGGGTAAQVRTQPQCLGR